MRSMLLCASMLMCATMIEAQPRTVAAPPTTESTLRAVEVRLARNDSLGALAVLDSALKIDRKNGVLWHRYGSIAWGMSKTEKGPVMRPEMVRLRMRADSAMRYATAFAPDSAQYFLDLGRYALETNLLPVRRGAKGNFEDGIKVARSQKRDGVTAEMLDQLGMFSWRDYDDVNHRAVEKSADDYASTPSPKAPTLVTYESMLPGEASKKVGPSVAQAKPVDVFRNFYAQYYRERLSLVTPVTGEAEFGLALRSFRDAYALDSTNPRVRRHLFMALADHDSWRDLLSASERALRIDNDDVQAWLARGIATAALEDYEAAAAAYGNALQRMTPAERSQFTDIRRMLRPYVIGQVGRYADTVRWASLPANERRRQESLFWNMADPRPATRVNEGMVEFFSRVAFADLRFGSEEFRVRGANSPRGETWVRYGRPDYVYSVPREGGLTSIIWVYWQQQLAFEFSMAPTFGTANYGFDDAATIDSIHAERPMGWDNLPLARRTWPMRMRIARFRSSADSMDAVVTATVPVRSFLEKADISGTLPISVNLDVNDPEARIVGRELRKVTVKSDSLPIGLNGSWVRRLGRGANVIRVDAEQEDVKRAASANADALVDSTSGFGISDLLLGTNPSATNGKAPARWTDVSIAPTTGVFPWAQAVGVVWEAYDLTPQDGNVRYKVHVDLSRSFKSNVVGFIARIAAYSKNAVQRDGSATGTVSVDFEQVRAAAPTIADFLSINLNGSVTGTYKLTITIEDLVSKKTVSRSAMLELTKD